MTIRFLTLLSLLLLVFGHSESVNAQVQQTVEFVPGEVIVKLKGKSKELRSQAFIGKAVSEKGMSLKGSFPSLNMHHFKLKLGKSVKQAIEELQNDPDIEFVEPNYIVRRQSTGIEGSPIKMSAVHSAAHAAATGTESVFSQTNAPIQQEEAWVAASSSGGEVVVAVIDTGIEPTHEVFVNSNALWVNSDEDPNNNIDDDRNGFVDDSWGWNFAYGNNSPIDDDGHGTHVAGIVLGATLDIRANPIAQSKIKIMPLKFLASDGSGTTSDAVQAIYYAVNNGAKVLNNSWGGGGYSNSLLEAMAYAYQRKVVFVAAAGNAAGDNDASPIYPASYTVPNVISVAATSDYDRLASFSNYGARSVHMGSPGVRVYSTYLENGFVAYSGTSMAAPFVSGIAAMILRESPEMSGYEVKNLIFDSGNKVSALVNKTSTQKRLNSYNSIQNAKLASGSGSQPSFDSSSVRSPSSEVSGSEAGGCGLVAKALYDSSLGGGGGGLSGPHKNMAFFALLLILMAPILLAIGMRNQNGRNARRYTRYQIQSAVTLQVGDKTLVGNVSSISLGGVQLNTDAWLEKGGIVKMSICSPDGRDEIQVEGKIVWSEEQKRYGVAFANAGEPVLSKIMRWTQALTSA